MSRVRSNEEHELLQAWWKGTTDYMLRQEIQEEKPCSCGLKEVHAQADSQNTSESRTPQQKWREFLKFMGPGWLVCVAYSDPGNMYASISSGAEFGYTQIWILWWAIVFSLFVGGLCTYSAHYSDHSLAELMCCAYPMPMRILMWLLGEITIIATDMPEVIGFGVALQILFGWPVPVGICLSLVTTMAFLVLEKMKGRYLETVVAIFMVILGVLLIAEMVMSNIDAGEMAYNWVVPSVLEGSAFSGLGIVGAVVMPHNLFLQTSSAMLRNKKATNSLLKLDEIQEVDSAPASGGKSSEVGNPPVGDEIEMSNCSDSREGSRADICRGTASTANIRIKASPATLKRRLWFAMLEPVVPVLFTFVMSLAIMCIAAALIYPRGQLDPSDPLYIDPTSVGLSNFPDYFQNGFMKYMWAIALLASAQAGSITTTLTGQYLMDGLVHLRIASWKRSLITRSLAIVPGVIVTSVNSSADASNAVIAVVNAVLAIMLPVFLFPLIRFCSSPKYMGNNRIPFYAEVIMILFSLFVTGFALLSFVAADGGMFGQYTDEPSAFGMQMNILQDVTIVTYVTLLGYLAFAPWVE